MKRICKAAVSLLLIAVLVLSGLPVQAKAAQFEPEIDYYGRAALAELARAEALLHIYDQMVSGVSTSKSRIEFDLSYEITLEDLTTAMDAYRRDHVEHFWLGNGYSYSTYPTGIAAVMPSYTLSGDALETAKAAFESAADEILAGLDSSMTEYAKELYIHDALADRIVYQQSTHAHDAYGALVEGIAVCEGYAESLQYLLHRAGIVSFIALGDAGGPHAWNYVQIDGKYYQVDLTWNDQGDNRYYSYFNQTDAVMQEDHSADPAAYALPVCDSTDAFYFTGKPTYMQTYTAASVGKLLKNNGWNVHVYVPGDVDEFISWYRANILEIAAAAGVNGGFSYGRSTLGRDVNLYFTNAGEPPKQHLNLISANGEATKYASVQDAIEDCTEGGYLKLIADCGESITVDTTCYLDLNGYDLTGDISGSGTLYVMDSKTDDFTVNDGEGYGTVTGTVTANISGVPVEATCAEDGYLMIDENKVLSFHRVRLNIKSMALRPNEAALYFRSEFDGDEMVSDKIVSFGVALSVTGEPNEATLTNPLHFTRFNKESFGSDADNTSTLLQGILKSSNLQETNDRNANMQVYGRAYIELENEQYIFGTTRNRSMRQQIELFDTKWTGAGDLQKAGALALFEKYSQVMNGWSIPNILQNAQ